jgi:RNA polymerase sigma-70 factor (ECF subfamily)
VGGVPGQGELGSAALEGLMARVAAARDRAAFGLLFDHFAPRLKSFLMRQGTAPATAEELVQEALLTVWRQAAAFDPAKATVSTWVFTIARNKRIDWLRRERRPELDPNDPLLVPDQPGAEQSLGASQEAALIRRALASLPPEQAEVIRLAYFEDKVHTTIAAETGTPLGTVKSRLRLALQRLAGLLKEV